MNAMNMPGFTAEAAIASGNERYRKIAPNNENGSELRVVPSSFLGDLGDFLGGCAAGYIAAGPLGCVLGGLGAAGPDLLGGGDASGGGIFGVDPCQAFGPCIGNGIRVGDKEYGVQMEFCYPYYFRTKPCEMPWSFHVHPSDRTGITLYSQ
jgi:hypothetical protein